MNDHYIATILHADKLNVTPETKLLIQVLTILSHTAHETAVQKGFYQAERNQGEIIALIHSELSEALEALRKGNPPDKHCPEFSSVEVELADAVIRIMDTCAANGWRLGAALVAKMKYNESRPPLNGKLF